METPVVQIAVVGFLSISHHVHPEALTWKKGEEESSESMCIYEISNNNKLNK